MSESYRAPSRSDRIHIQIAQSTPPPAAGIAPARAAVEKMTSAPCPWVGMGAARHVLVSPLDLQY